MTALSALTGVAMAQTTGSIGFNDYTIGGFGSGETSGTAGTTLTFSGGGPTLFEFSGPAKDMPVMLFFRTCVGNSCWFPWLPDSACPLTAGICGLATNQSIDFDPTCPGVDVLLTTENFGLLSVEIDLPEDIAFSTQALIMDPSLSTCVGSGLGMVFSQAYDVSTF